MAYYQTCTVCDGTGKLTCSRCGGSGKVFGNLHRFTQYTCSQCKGSGTTGTCWKCYGMGSVEIEDDDD